MKQYRTIEQMCSDGHSITLSLHDRDYMHCMLKSFPRNLTTS